MSVSSAPEISVVIPSVNGAGDLFACLIALRAAGRSAVLEVIVADRCGNSLRERLRREFPEVHVLAAAPDTSIPDLRAMAIDAATADAVAVIEDHVQVPPTWARAMLDAQAHHGSVIGGTVVNAANDTAVDRAAFLCEYSHLLPPLPAGPCTALAGNNVSYQRALLLAHRHLLGNGQWENGLHAGLRANGVALICRPDIQVAHKKHYRFTEYLSQRFLYARSYAGVRVTAMSAVMRVAYGLAAVALPPVLLSRIAARLWTRRAYRRQLLTSLPLLCPFVCAWAAGEVIGAWFGAGRSLSRVR